MTGKNKAVTCDRCRLTDSQIRGYLERIGIDAPQTPSADRLKQLHVAHLIEVPFENLDIHANRPISLRLEDLYNKIVVRRRGGFCYELNELFRRFLEGLGYTVRLVSSQVWMPDGTLSPPFEHAALLVELNGTRLVDVGFGDAFMTPHPLGTEWTDPDRRLRTIPIPDGWRLEANRGEGWYPVYDLDHTPREIEAFAARCRWQETSSQSFFRQAPLISRATPTGRVTIMGDRFLRIHHGERTEDVWADSSAFEQIQDYFGAPILEQLREIGLLHT